ncbi:MAG: NAD-dependent epimerase/dehydratase family protein [Acidobacteria bacterium]|nr:NAD-dependent epimerase/dehydratase family protein [Acidobacteriota bacterium]
MRILITGGNGFVGGSFGRLAARAGHEVLGVGRASQAARGWLGAYAQADAASADLSPLVRDFAPDVLFHAAGTASVAASINAPLQDLRASALTFANLLDSVRRSGTRPVVLFPSSAAVYGEPATLPVAEDAPASPISPYGFHKAACELVAREYADCFGVRVAVCRLFSLFGAAQRRLLVWELYRQFAGAGETVWLEGTGDETRDYLHVDDVASALLALADTQLAARATSGANFITVNVASGEATRVADLAAQIRALVAPAKEIRARGVARPGDPRAWRADITRLRALIPGWQPAPLADSLARCVARWRKESD